MHLAGSPKPPPLANWPKGTPSKAPGRLFLKGLQRAFWTWTHLPLASCHLPSLSSSWESEKSRHQLVFPTLVGERGREEWQSGIAGGGMGVPAQTAPRKGGRKLFKEPPFVSLVSLPLMDKKPSKKASAAAMCTLQIPIP